MTALGLVAALLGGTAGWLVSPQLLPSPLARRARQLGRRPAQTRRDWRALADAAATRLAAGLPPSLHRIARAEAESAGWPADAAPRLLTLSLLLPPLLTLFAGLAGGGPLTILLAAFAGAAAPWLCARNAALRRDQALAAGLPDALDLLVICAESGLPIDTALTRAARELSPVQPVIAAELAATAAELSILLRRADAFANLARRVPLPSVQALTDALIQTERFGTPLATALATMAAESRSARLLAAEARAARLPALMTVPMIAFVLPPLFVVLIGPAVVDALM
jgi:tight adherence protein C